jgi:hypothetical protein
VPDLPLDRLLDLVGAEVEVSLPDGRIDAVDADAWERFLSMLGESGWLVTLDDQPVEDAAKVEDLGITTGPAPTLRSAWRRDALGSIWGKGGCQ